MKALTVRAPWWWFILHAGKDIENRNWATGIRGRICLHASAWWGHDEGHDDIRAALDCCGTRREEIAQKIDVVEGMIAHGGCLVGSVEIVDCVNHSESPWFFGKFGFVLANPVAFARPIPLPGKLGFFDVPDWALKEAGVL